MIRKLTSLFAVCLLAALPLFSQSIMLFSGGVKCDMTTAAPTVVGSAIRCSANPGSACTMSFTNTAGNHIYLADSSGAPGTLSFSDSNGNTYTTVNPALVSSGNAPGDTVSETAVADNIASGSNTITCNSTGGVYFLFCQAFEFHSSKGTGNVLDQVSAQSVAVSSTNSDTGHTPIIHQAHELAVDTFESSGFPVAGSQVSPYSQIIDNGPNTGHSAFVTASLTTGSCQHQIGRFFHNTVFSSNQIATFK